MKYENATSTSEITGDYYIECSPEFLTAKLQPLENKEVPPFISPFINAIGEMGHEGYRAFRMRISHFSQLLKDWPRVRRINELWLAKNLQLLAKDIAEFLPPDQFPMKNDLQSLMAVRRLNLIFLNPVIDQKKFSLTYEKLIGHQRDSTHSTVSELMDLARSLNERGVLQRLDERVLMMFDHFTSRFQHLIPAFGLKSYKAVSAETMSSRGITTTSIEDLKQFFIDYTELATELLVLIVGWNNVFERGSWNQMAPRRRDVCTLADFESKSKGTRVQFVTGSGTFDTLVYPVLDAPMRNALAHGSYRMEPVSQQITYYPDGKEDEASRRSIFMTEFLMKCLDLFDVVHSLYELLYQTRKLAFLYSGQTPIPPPGLIRSPP